MLDGYDGVPSDFSRYAETLSVDLNEAIGGVPMNEDPTREGTLDRYSTHAVLNQAKSASGFNAFTGDAVLRAAIEREAPWAADRCEALGAIAGDEHVQELARLAKPSPPRTQDT